MPRPSFTVVSGTLVVLAMFGAFRRYVEPLIPLPYGAVSPESADYLRAGEIQPIRWRPLSPDLLAEATRRRKPILLFLGSEGNPVARGLDARALLDPEVIRMVRETFLPARIDLAASPAWRAALAPATRTGGGPVEGFAMVAIDPDGRPVLSKAPPALGMRYERDEIAGFLAAARGHLAARPERYQAELIREQEDALVRNARRELPPPDAALALRTRTDERTGLMLVPGGARLAPWVLDAIARAGEVRWAASALAALAASPMNDPIDGGVFASVATNGREIECTKALLPNAALAETAARIAAATGDPAVDRLARRTADWCLRRLNDGAPAFVVCDRDRGRISPYYSLTFRRLRGAGISSDEGAFRAELGADRDPQSLGRLTRAPSAAIAADLALLARKGPRPLSRNRNLPAVRATTIARLLGAARLSNDPARARLLGAQLDELERGMDRATADLVLLLALADAHWADFLANGRAEGLDLAARDLERALSRYGGSDGTLRAGDGIAGLTLAPDAPDLADSGREASAAVALRLAVGIGRAYERGPQADRFGRWARLCARRYAPVLGIGPNTPNGAPAPESAGFLGACAELSATTWRVAAGSDPVTAARDEARRYPFDLVIPVVGASAPDVPRSVEGITLRTAP